MSSIQQEIVNSIEEIKKAKNEIVRLNKLVKRYDSNLRFAVKEVNEVKGRNNKLNNRLNNLGLNMASVEIENDTLRNEIERCERNLNSFIIKFLNNQPDSKNILNRDLLQKVKSFL